MPRKSCLLPACAVALLFAAGPAVAASGPATPPLAVGGSDLLRQAWGWIVSVWSDARCGIDPDGGDAACAPLVAEPKLGPCIDPNGGDAACAPLATQSKLRAGIDPNGGNGTGSPSTYFMKLRCGINPDGSTVCVP